MPPPSASMFWALMDRWRMSDNEALELVSYDGKLPSPGKRPRFRLSPDQRRVMAVLLENRQRDADRWHSTIADTRSFSDAALQRTGGE